jgi:hypothetical protein
MIEKGNEDWLRKKWEERDLKSLISMVERNKKFPATHPSDIEYDTFLEKYILEKKLEKL